MAADLEGPAFPDDLEVVEGAGHFRPGIDRVTEADGGRANHEIRLLDARDGAPGFGGRGFIGDQVGADRLFELRK